MSLFDIPYRWTWGTLWRNIGWMGYSLKRGLCNIIRWTPIIWGDEDFDWCFLARVMEWKLHTMSSFFQKYGHHIGSSRDARQMLICAELLRRLREDESDGLDGLVHEKRMRGWQMMCGAIIGKHLRNWWD